MRVKVIFPVHLIQRQADASVSTIRVARRCERIGSRQGPLASTYRPATC
ncbi:protein of unknown function [Pararobbsia alpina]